MKGASVIPASILKGLVAVLSAVFVLFHLYTAAAGSFPAHLQRTVHLGFVLVIGFLLAAQAAEKAPARAAGVLAAAAAAAAFIYLALETGRISQRQVLVSPLSSLDIAAGAAVLLLVLTAAVKMIGKAIVLLVGAFLGYALAGPFMPGRLAHRGITLREIFDYQVFSLEGMFSFPLGVSATYIAMFVIFGTLLDAGGAGKLIMDLGTIAAGRSRGGPAKIAVITSGLFGMISGSAAANVYATGTLTIPMMKRIGYKADTAAGVEAAASTGGQLMPPVMGAAAFVMADILGVPYLTVVTAAVLPSIIYFLTIVLVLDFIAAKNGLTGLPRGDIPSFRSVVPRLYHLLPIGVLVAVLLSGYTPFRAALFGVAAAAAVSLAAPGRGTFIRGIPMLCVTAAKRICMIATACAAAGLVIGVVMITGFGLALSGLLLGISESSLVLTLVLIMITCIVMGMGTPTTVAYIITATLAAPVLVRLGYPPLSAHLFVLYFSVLSMITPPVAISAYAAADIAGVPPMRAAAKASLFGLIAFCVPFLFLYDSALLMQGTWYQGVFSFLAAAAGALFIAAGSTGWLFSPLSPLLRAFILTAAFTALVPAPMVRVLGILLGGLGIALVFLQRKKVHRRGSSLVSRNFSR